MKDAREHQGYEKITFVLEQDEDGYPPVGAESVWARKDEGTGHFVIDNVPFFATQATLGDKVIAAVDDGQLRYVGTVETSTNSLVRVVCYKDTDPDEVRKPLQDMGCSTELLTEYSIIAVNIPPQVALTQVQEFLQRGAADEMWDYEEPLLRQ